MAPVAEHPERNWITGLPKAEVHLHLEGAVPADVAGVADAGSSAPTIDSLADLLSYLDRLCGRIEHVDQLGEIARRLSERGVKAGARHLDVIMNPTHWPHWHHRLGDMIDALDGPLREAELDGGPTVGICVSLSRTYSAQVADELVEVVLDLAHPRVVGISIDGDEAAGSHNERFASAFATARRGGLRRCAHAGESSGPAGVREAVEILGAERIDHGIRCVEDPALVAELAERRVPLDICPTSNLVLGLVDNLSAHPIEALRQAGVRVSVNTDDPLLYGIDLVGEYERCASRFGWGRSELGDVARTSIESCFASPDRRAEMLGELDRYLKS
jgi:adenosine deaminase